MYPGRQLHVPLIVSQGEDSCSITHKQFWRQSVPQVPGTQAVVVVVEYKYNGRGDTDVPVNLLLQSTPVYLSSHSQVPSVMLQFPWTHSGTHPEAKQIKTYFTVRDTVHLFIGS